MIHIDVSIQRDKEFVNDHMLVAIEVSADGSPWLRLATFPVLPETNDMNETQQKNRARDLAKWWMEGARFAGADVRATSFGQEGL